MKMINKLNELLDNINNIMKHNNYVEDSLYEELSEVAIELTSIMSYCHKPDIYQSIDKHIRFNAIAKEAIIDAEHLLQHIKIIPRVNM
jgi:hypothetical protein